MQDTPEQEGDSEHMGWFNLFEKIFFHGSESERYDPKEELRDHTGYYIKRIRKELKEREKKGIATPYKIDVYAKCDIDGICKAFSKRGYKVTTDGIRQITIIKK